MSAFAADYAGNSVRRDTAVAVSFAGSDTDIPVAAIDSPSDTVVFIRIPIQGTAFDSSFAWYSLSYRDVNEAESGYHEYYRSEQPVVSGTLGIFDATNRENGDYVVRLSVYDRFGRVSSAQIQLRVESEHTNYECFLFFSTVCRSFPFFRAARSAYESGGLQPEKTF